MPCSRSQRRPSNRLLTRAARRVLPSRDRKGTVAIVLALLATAAASAGLPDRFGHAEAGSLLERIFYRTVATPGGPVPAKRRPEETRAALSVAIASRTEEAELHALRAQEAERALDTIAAEADWKAYAERVADPAEGQRELADFYGRRLRAEEQVAALLEVGRAPSPPAERYTPPQEQRSWEAFVEAEEVIAAHLLAAETKIELYRAWVGRYPERREPYSRYLDALLEQESYEAARGLVAEMEQAFEGDDVALFEAGARITRAEEGVEAARDAMEEAFRADWSPALIRLYLQTLEDADQLRARLAEARAAVRRDPRELRPAAWLFHYYQRQGDRAAAVAALDAFRQAHDAASFVPAELRILAGLYRQTNQFQDAARAVYALYSLPSAESGDREFALAELAELLLTAPEQQLRFGSKDFSFYKDIATLDENPGFFNGILSLLFNEQGLRWQFSSTEQASRAYSHRVGAAELLDRFAREFPDSPRRTALDAQVVEAFGLYGADEGAIARATRFLESFPDAPQRSEVSLRLAEAYARTGRVEEELAVYDSLLEELAAKADGAPLGSGTVANRIGRIRPGRPQSTGLARSPDYARVLDRAIARLAALQRLPDAVALYVREIARNPADPGLYERFASFLDVNGMASRVESVYRQAMDQFEDRSWEHKLARWYVRRKKSAEFEQLTREVTQAFAGSELERYFQDINAGSFDAQMYLRLNLYAHQRFPHNLVFVRNLLHAYSTRPTRNPAAWEKLLREHWLHADDLRGQFFAFLVRTGKLESEIAALEAQSADARAGRWNAAARDNPVLTLTLGEAEAWRCHFEDAAPKLLAVSTEAPVDDPFVPRAAALHRSLAYENPLQGDVAAALYEGLANAAPGDRQRWAIAGDALADRGLFARAEPLWERMPAAAPGSSDAYLDAATVFWDYYLFDDALRLLGEGRRRLGKPALYSFEAGAIYEGKNDPESAIQQYLQGALDGDGDYGSRNRLTTLARREPYAETIEQATSRLAAGRQPSVAAVRLRAELLRRQQRDEDLRALLLRLAGDAETPALLATVESLASGRGFEPVRVRALERRIELTRDPVTAMRLRLELARMHESMEDLAAARQILDALYMENPRILGIVRARTDYLWRRDAKAGAVDTLIEAAEAAYPALAEQFRFEAASKAAEAELYPRAEMLLAGLLDAKPFDARYLAARADVYARQNQDAELRAFYEEKLAAVSDSELSATAKRNTAASLRRGLIPALTRLGDRAAAVDQYVELVNRFPEDRALVEEAALYAQENAQAERFEQFYVRTTEQSPRDVRYHRVLAWLRTSLEDFPGAIEAYEHALAVRPESVALHEARAELLFRLLRFEEAGREYEQLYTLSYEDPRWMVKIAENAARRGEAGEAVTAIRKAHIDGRPEKPQNFFAAAEALEEWGLIEQAEAVAREGVEAAGERLWRDYALESGLRLEARLLTRLRRADAIADLAPAQPNDSYPYRLQNVLRESVAAADRYLTPEERAAYVTLLDGWRGQGGPRFPGQALLAALQAGGFADVEARWLFESVLANPAADTAQQQRQRLIGLQRTRMQHAELGAQLEQIWEAHPDRVRQGHILDEAAAAYRVAGDEDAELAALERRGGYGPLTERYFDLLLARTPDRLIALASGGNRSRARQAADYAVLRGDAELARRAIEAYGAKRPAVWTPAYTGLAGLFHQAGEARYAQAFRTALGEETIGERVGIAVDRNRRLAGDVWFEYGARFGEYLAAFEPAAADDYIRADVERVPGRASGYFDLAEILREHRRPAAAATEYAHTLELDPDDARAHERLGAMAWAEGNLTAAFEHWRHALETYTARARRHAFGPSWWDEVTALIATLGENGGLQALREPLDSLLTTYLKGNGVYRAEELLRAWLTNAPDAAAELELLLAKAEVSPVPVQYATALAEAPWLPRDQRDRAMAEAIRLAEDAVAVAAPENRYYPREALQNRQTARLHFLLDGAETEKAAALLAEAGDNFRASLAMREPALLLRAAAQSGDLESTLAWLEDNSLNPANEVLRDAAAALRNDGAAAEADKLLELFYERRIEQRDFAAASFLGLAELRLRQQRPAEARDLIQRMLRVSGQPFEHHGAAADLLLVHDQAAIAVQLLGERARAYPWDGEARVKQAAAEIASAAEPEARKAALAEAARDPRRAYATRVAAARALGQSSGSEATLGSGELELIARSGIPAAAEAQRPGYLHARILAAQAEIDPAVRTRLLQAALAQQPEEQDPQARLGLFTEARAAGRHSAAVAVLEPLFDRTSFDYLLRQTSSIFNVDAPRQRVDEWMTQQFLPGVDGRRRAVTASAMADSLRSLDRLAPAAVFYEIALRLEPDSAVQRALDAVRAELERLAENARRRPAIHDELEQSDPVHPKLEADR